MLINNRYQVIRTLGEGGFGQAYLAIDQQMPSQRKCAIKQLKPITNSPQTYQLVQARFQREAAILEKLGEDHPQIPRLYAYFSENLQFYLVQEWIDGITLESLVAQQGPQSEATTRSILAALLPVLSFIHSQGIIHRDIKPDNIILRMNTQQPVLIDFGAVRETMTTVMDSQEIPKSSITIGTPGFMPPEQAVGRPILSSDLYSLGLVAIYLLTGRLPQSFETDVQTGEIVWQAAAQHVSAGFVALLDRAVRSHPRDRYSSAQDMLSALLALPATAEAPAQLAIPASIHTSADPSAVPLQYHPLAADSTLKTVAVAPAQPTREISQQSSFDLPEGLPEENLGKTVVGNVPFNNVSYQSSTDRRRPTKRLMPLVIGLSVIVVGGAIAAGVRLSQSPDDTTPSQDSVLEANKNTSKQASTQATDDAQAKAKLKATDGATDSAAEETPEPAAPTEATEPAVEESSPQTETQASGGQVTLGSSSGKPIPIYDSPSFASQSSQSGSSGDRVTVLKQAQGDDGSTWYLARFSSGAEGWIAQAYADPSSYGADSKPASAPSSSAPSAAPETSSQAAPPPSSSPKASSAQIAGGSGTQVNVYAAPSSDSNSPHYGLGGDRVTILNSTQGKDGRTWYQVQFASGASGWVSADSVQTP